MIVSRFVVEQFYIQGLQCIIQTMRVSNYSIVLLNLKLLYIKTALYLNCQTLYSLYVHVND